MRRGNRHRQKEQVYKDGTGHATKRNEKWRADAGEEADADADADTLADPDGRQLRVELIL